MGTEYILQMKNIKKSFSGVEVLHGVDLDVRAGEVRALVGENGTGKSTLMKILGGIYDSDSGEIYINGKKTSISSAQDAQDLGVSIIHQEIVLVQDITVGLMGAGRSELANALFGIDKLTSGSIYLEGEKCFISSPEIAIKNKIGLVTEDRKLTGLFLQNDIAFNMTITVLNDVIHGIRVNRKLEQQILDSHIHLLDIKMAGTDQLAVELSGGNQQKVVISKWLAANPRILILDEPTRGVDVGAKSDIYHLITKIAEQGVAVIFISSELPEVMNMSTRIGVMCEGELVKFMDPRKEEVTQEKIMLNIQECMCH